MKQMKDIRTHVTPTWCPGCGDYFILLAVQKALIEQDIDLKDVVIVSGIGCGSKIPHYVNVYGFEGLHGRAVPPAEAIIMCNHKLHVIVISGDGDNLGIGLGHFIHACRRNNNIVHIIQNNEIYGLTKGQYSPTSPVGTISGTTPLGSIDIPINPIALAIAANASFVAREYSEDVDKLKDRIIEAMNHPGYALIDTLQDCPTWNKHNTPQWYKENTEKLPDNHDFKSKEKALMQAIRTDKLVLGVFYKIDVVAYEEQLPMVHNKEPIACQDISYIDIDPIFESFSK